jgi:cell wall-associated NlpC family hydrolase
MKRLLAILALAGVVAGALSSGAVAASAFADAATPLVLAQATDAKAPAAPAPAAATPAPAAQSSKKGSIAAENAKPKAPPLDLASLEQRLKDTPAIGVLTKITLKNQVDDLLSQFRAFYQGTFKTDLANLRRSYDLLFLKVLSLLQDSDQALATAIVASRDAIWGILSDPAKFATI